MAEIFNKHVVQQIRATTSIWNARCTNYVSFTTAMLETAEIERCGLRWCNTFEKDVVLDGAIYNRRV